MFLESLLHREYIIKNLKIIVPSLAIFLCGAYFFIFYQNGTGEGYVNTKIASLNENEQKRLSFLRDPSFEVSNLSVDPVYGGLGKIHVSLSIKNLRNSKADIPYLFHLMERQGDSWGILDRVIPSEKLSLDPGETKIRQFTFVPSRVLTLKPEKSYQLEVVFADENGFAVSEISDQFVFPFYSQEDVDLSKLQAGIFQEENQNHCVLDVSGREKISFPFHSLDLKTGESGKIVCTIRNDKLKDGLKVVTLVDTYGASPFFEKKALLQKEISVDFGSEERVVAEIPAEGSSVDNLVFIIEGDYFRLPVYLSISRSVASEEGVADSVFVIVAIAILVFAIFILILFFRKRPNAILMILVVFGFFAHSGVVEAKNIPVNHFVHNDFTGEDVLTVSALVKIPDQVSLGVDVVADAEMMRLVIPAEPIMCKQGTLPGRDLCTEVYMKPSGASGWTVVHFAPGDASLTPNPALSGYPDIARFPVKKVVRTIPLDTDSHIKGNFAIMNDSAEGVGTFDIAICTYNNHGATVCTTTSAPFVVGNALSAPTISGSNKVFASVLYNYTVAGGTSSLNYNLYYRIKRAEDTKGTKYPNIPTSDPHSPVSVAPFIFVLGIDTFPVALTAQTCTTDPGYEICSGSSAPFLVDLDTSNNYPTRPIIAGADSAIIGSPYTFSVSGSTDPDGDDIYYHVEVQDMSLYMKFRMDFMAGSISRSELEQSWAYYGYPSALMIYKNTELFTPPRGESFSITPSLYYVPFPIVAIYAAAVDIHGLSDSLVGKFVTLSPGALTNGICGSATSIATATSPYLNLCFSGVPTPVSGETSWIWGCRGLNGGIDSPLCSATMLTSNIPPSVTNVDGPTTGTVNTAVSFTATGIDPDDDTLRYGFDWSDDGVVDEWMPASGYVASGTAQTVSRTWNTAGNQTFRVYAQDQKGAMSVGYVTHVINISSATLKICPFSDCSGGTPYNTMSSFSNIPVTLYACSGTGTCSAGDIPVSGTWTANNFPGDAIAISSTFGPSTDVSRTYTGTGSASEEITLADGTLPSVKATAHVSCVALTCKSGSIKTQTDTYCGTESKAFPNGCSGTISCPGTRYCDMNWKEVAPGQ